MWDEGRVGYSQNKSLCIHDPYSYLPSSHLLRPSRGQFSRLVVYGSLGGVHKDLSRFLTGAWLVIRRLWTGF